MKRILSFIPLFVGGTLLFSQPARDSLFNIWQDLEVADSFRMAAFHKMIIDHYVFPEPDSAIEFAQQLLTYAEQKRSDHFMGEAYNTLAWAAGSKSNYRQALENNQKGIEIAERSGDSIVLSKCVSDIGIAYLNLGDMMMAYRSFLRAMDINKAIGNDLYYSYNVGNMGNIFLRLEEWDQAEQYILKMLELNEKINDQQAVAVATANLGIIYVNRKDTLKAFQYWKKGLTLATKGSYTSLAANLNIMLTYLYLSTSELDSARHHINEIERISEKIDGAYIRGARKILVCLLLSKEGKDIEAIDFCQEAYKWARISGLVQPQEASLEVLVDINRRLNRLNVAFEYNDKLTSLLDSLDKDKIKTAIERQQFNDQIRLDSLKRVEEERLAQLIFAEEVNRENRKKKMAMGAGLLLLIFAGGLWSRLRYIRRAKEVIQQERDRSENLLLNILPEEIARELKDRGRADAKSFDQASILFTDFKEFTQTSEKMSAHELVGEINYFFEAFDGICEKYGIEKIKTIGDSYMAAGGIPVPGDDAVRSTVLAALEMQELVEARKLHRRESGQLAFEMRAGINTGHVVAGIVGVKKFQYDIWGDTVNTASRMESHGQIGQVNISQSTYEHIKDDPDFKFRSRGKILTKGKGEVAMYFVERTDART